MRRFVMGDIHGAYKGLIQCLERSEFDYENDQLIFLGDVCDGWPETNQAIEELLKIKHLTFTMGNHDFWALQWAKEGKKSHVWLSQGGRNTVESYGGKPMPKSHVELLENAKEFFIWENRLFVHAGIDPYRPLTEQDKEIFLWDRALVKRAYDKFEQNQQEPLTEYKAVYVGHTPIHNYGYYEPIKACDVWLMDTGAGWDGVLSMMELETEEIFTSDRINTLYPPGSGRSRF